MFVDPKDMSAFGGSDLSAWSCVERGPVGGGCANDQRVPTVTDVEALLEMLSCRVDNEEPINQEPSAQYERLEMQSWPSSSEGAEECASSTHGSIKAGGDFLHFFNQHDTDGASLKLLKPENLMKGGAYGCTASSTYGYPGSSSPPTLMGNSSTSSRTDPPASTTTSHGTESTTHVSTPHPSRHNTAVSNALANIGSGLAEENFNVLTPDKRTMLSIPAEYIQTTLGSCNYCHRHRQRDKLLFSFYLCKTHCSGATCHHGSDCDFIHCDPDKLRLVRSAEEWKGKKADPTSVHSFQVHWSTPVNSLAEAMYPCLPSGHFVYVKSSEKASGNTTQALPSEMVYATVGGHGALRLPSTAPLRICKHYEREKCARGALCHFIHPVVLSKPAGPACAAGFAGVAAASQNAKALNARCTPVSTPCAFSPFSEHGHLATCAAPPPPPTAVASASGLLLTTAQVPASAPMHQSDTVFMWFPEQQQLMPLSTTANPSAPHMAGPPSAMMVNCDYQCWPSGAGSSPAGFQVPVNGFFMSSPIAVAAYPPRSVYSSPLMQRSQETLSAPNVPGPVYHSMLFPC